MRILIILLLLVSSANPSHAAVDLENQFWSKDGTPVTNEFTSPTDFINVLLPNVLILAGLILLFLFVFGGFKIVSSQGSAEQVEQGKKAMTGALVGFLVVFSSYWIIQVIQVITGVQILNSPLT